ncbi:hypothetical protein V6N11_060590 [Hibiscus sabdariffa]|uniref:RNase H type-1 domain-containing protein n=1 Tax=Hibiscus sabdariffa TaxID=183260 RepID=A0ABR2QQS9_9ROSI
MDVNYVFRCDFLRCCERLAREYVVEFHKPNLAVLFETDNAEVALILQGHSDALGGCTLVDSILLFLARSWSMCSCHIPRTQNLVADRVVVDRVVALCRGSSIVSMMFDSVPVALVELVRKEAAAG